MACSTFLYFVCLWIFLADRCSIFQHRARVTPGNFIPHLFGDHSLGKCFDLHQKTVIDSGAGIVILFLSDDRNSREELGPVFFLDVPGPDDLF